jgi:hypothetical protein
VTRDDLAELRDWYGRAVRDLERPADMTERRQGVPGPDRPPRFVLSGDAAGAYLAAPPAQVRDTAGRGIVRDRARALQLVSGGSDVMAKMAADLMPDLRRGRRSLDPAAWIRAIAWYHLVSGGMTQREAARVVIRWMTNAAHRERTRTPPLCYAGGRVGPGWRSGNGSAIGRPPSSRRAGASSRCYRARIRHPEPTLRGPTMAAWQTRYAPVLLAWTSGSGASRSASHRRT